MPPEMNTSCLERHLELVAVDPRKSYSKHLCPSERSEESNIWCLLKEILRSFHSLRMTNRMTNMQGLSGNFVKQISLCLILFLVVGCVQNVREIPLNREGMKDIRTVAILTPTTRPDITMDTMSDDRFLMMLFSGPAIIPILMSQVAMIDAKRQESKEFNALTYDVHVGRMLREDLFNKLKRQARFHIVPPDEVDDNITVYKLENKYPKTKDDYEMIAKQLGADTIIEIDVLTYGVNDPGIFAKPHSLIIAKVVMTRARSNEVLWQTKIGQALPQDKKLGFDYEKYREDNARLLKEELDTLSSMLSEQIIEALGFEAMIPTAQLLKEPPPK